MPESIAIPEVSPADSRPVSGAPATGAKPSNFTPRNPASDRVGHAIQARANKAAGLPEPPKPKAAKVESPAPSVGDPNAVEPVTKPGDASAAKPADETLSTAKTDEQESPATTDEAAKGEDGKPKSEAKVKPWKLVEQYKKTASELKAKTESLEAELAKLRSGAPPEAATKEITERATSAEKRVKELEDELRFTKYEKHPEFQEKYGKPYEQAWKRATSELSEVSVTDPATGAIRAATAEDMLALVNLPLGKAREYANQLFGAFADDAMGHRKEIKSLFESQQLALKEARENGSKREAQQREQTEAQRTAMHRELTTHWEDSNKSVRSDPVVGKYLNPVEGDKVWNEVLEKATKFSDGAFAVDPRDPNITPEQRKEAVAKHAAMRNRSIAYGTQKLTIQNLTKENAELKKMLDEFSDSEPSTTPTNGKASGSSAVAAPFETRFKEKLLKRAR